MIKTLSFNSIVSRSFKSVKQRLKPLCLFFVLSFIGIYTAQIADPTDSLIQTLLYLSYTYLFYYFFTRFYFNRQPLWNFASFKNALIRMIAILLLAFAGLVLLRISLYALFWLLSPLQYLPSTKGAVAAFLEFCTQSRSVRYLLYILMFALLTGMFFIPSMAWVSAALGRDSSITMTFFRTRGNYMRLTLLFLIAYGFLPLLIILLGYGNIWLSSLLSAAYTVIQSIIYLQTYEFFYPRPRRRKSPNKD